MTTNEMMAKLKGIGNAKTKEEAAIRASKMADLQKILDGVYKVLPKLREIRPVVQSLYDNRVLTFRHDGFYTTNKFFTDGFNHVFGFVNDGGFMSHPYASSLVGNIGGGCSGASFLVDVVTGKIATTDCPYKTCNFNTYTPNEIVLQYWDSFSLTGKASHFVASTNEMLEEIEKLVGAL